MLRAARRRPFAFERFPLLMLHCDMSATVPGECGDAGVAEAVRLW